MTSHLETLQHAELQKMIEAEAEIARLQAEREPHAQKLREFTHNMLPELLLLNAQPMKSEIVCTQLAQRDRFSQQMAVEDVMFGVMRARLGRLDAKVEEERQKGKEAETMLYRISMYKLKKAKADKEGKDIETLEEWLRGKGRSYEPYEEKF